MPWSFRTGSVFDLELRHRMRFSTLIQDLQTGEAELRWSACGTDPILAGAASLEQAKGDQLSFLEKGNALISALNETGAGALLLPDQPDLIQCARERGIAFAVLAIHGWPLLKRWSVFIHGCALWRKFIPPQWSMSGRWLALEPLSPHASVSARRAELAPIASFTQGS